MKEHQNKFKNLNIKFEDSDTFWIDFKKQDDKGERVYTGKVRMRIDVVPKDYAERNKVGAGRTEPNHSPFLKPPEGRIELSYNPLKMLMQMVGPEQRAVIYRYICCATCVLLCLMLFPLIAGDLISSIIRGLFGLG